MRWICFRVGADQIEHAIEIEIAQRRATSASIERDAGRIASFDEDPVMSAEQQIVGIICREIRHLLHIALGDKEIGQPVIVDVAHRAASACQLGAISAELGRALKFDPEKETFSDADANALVMRKLHGGWDLQA